MISQAGERRIIPGSGPVRIIRGRWLKSLAASLNALVPYPRRLPTSPNERVG
jgi:hypothetical protein